MLLASFGLPASRDRGEHTAVVVHTLDVAAKSIKMTCNPNSPFRHAPEGMELACLHGEGGGGGLERCMMVDGV